MGFRHIRLMVIGLVVMCIGACGSQTNDENIVLRLGHTLDTKHSVHKAMVYFGERLAMYSDNKMSVKIYPGGQLGSEREMIELLQIGSLDITKVSASPLESFAPEMQIFSIPYVFRDNTHFWQVLNSNIGREILNSISKYELKGLGYYDSGSRSFYTTNHPIRTPDDLKGVKIRVHNNPTAIRMIRELGGAATPVSWGELYTALQQGVVDGAENNPPSYYLSRHYEIAGYYSLDEHTSIPDVVLISERTWTKLTPEQQGWLQRAMDDSVAYQRQLWQASTIESLEQIKAAGVQVIYPDKQPFMDAMKPFHQSLKETEVGKLLEKIKRM